MCDRKLSILSLVLAAVGAAIPATTWADADEPSAALDRKLLIEDKGTPSPQRPGIAPASAKSASTPNHMLDFELATEYGIDDEALAGTLRAIYTYKPWAQLRVSAAGTQSSFGDDDLSEGVLSAGVGFKARKWFSWRATGLVKIAERTDADTMITSTAVTPGIDGQGRIELKLRGRKLITSGRIGVRFPDPTTVIGVLSEVIQINETFRVGVLLTGTVLDGDIALQGELSVAATLDQFELGIAAGTPVDELAMVASVYMAYTYSPVR